MLKVESTRQVTVDFIADDKEVKQVVLNFSKNGVCIMFESIFDFDLYTKHRQEMRKDENALISLKQKIEDEIVSGLVENDSTKLISEIEKTNDKRNEIIKEHITKDPQKLKDLASRWIVDEEYKKDDIRQYNGVVYKCLKNHKSDYDNIPTLSKDLWELITK